MSTETDAMLLQDKFVFEMGVADQKPSLTCGLKFNLMRVIALKCGKVLRYVEKQRRVFNVKLRDWVIIEMERDKPVIREQPCHGRLWVDLPEIPDLD